MLLLNFSTTIELNKIWRNLSHAFMNRISFQQLFGQSKWKKFGKFNVVGCPQKGQQQSPSFWRILFKAIQVRLQQPYQNISKHSDLHEQTSRVQLEIWLGNHSALPTPPRSTVSFVFRLSPTWPKMLFLFRSSACYLWRNFCEIIDFLATISVDDGTDEEKKGQPNDKTPD